MSLKIGKFKLFTCESCGCFCFINGYAHSIEHSIEHFGKKYSQTDSWEWGRTSLGCGKVIHDAYRELGYEI